MQTLPLIGNDAAGVVAAIQRTSANVLIFTVRLLGLLLQGEKTVSPMELNVENLFAIICCN